MDRKPNRPSDIKLSPDQAVPHHAGPIDVKSTPHTLTEVDEPSCCAHRCEAVHHPDPVKAHSSSWHAG